MKILKHEKAKALLDKLKKNKKLLCVSVYQVKGYYREEPYLWVAFDNTTGEKWVSQWQQQRDAETWLKDKNANLDSAPVYCWLYPK